MTNTTIRFVCGTERKEIIPPQPKTLSKVLNWIQGLLHSSHCLWLAVNQFYKRNVGADKRS